MTSFKRFLRGASALVLTGFMTLAVVTAAGGPAGSVSAAATTQPGYWLIGDHGGVYNFGAATALPGISGVSAPFVAAAATPTGKGLWLAASDGTIYTVGDAVTYIEANKA